MERFFFRESENDKWHWLSSFPHFPDKTHPQIVKSDTFPEAEKICMHCLGIEMKNFKENTFLNRRQSSQ